MTEKTTKATEKTTKATEKTTKATEKTAQEVTDMTTEQTNALEIYDESDFGAGFEDASQNSFSIPIIRILQDQSPQVKRHNEKYIEGAKPGMIFNTVTKEVFDGEEKGILIVPCFFNEVVCIYKQRKNGGGFVSMHNPEDAPQVVGYDDKNKPLDKDKNSIVDTRQHFVLHIKDDGSFSPVLMPMYSTNITVSRNWMSFMREQRVLIDGRLRSLPMFASYYRATTRIKTKGNDSWHVWHIEKIGDSREVIPLELTKTFYLTFKEDSAALASQAHETDYEQNNDNGQVFDSKDDVWGD